MSKHDDVYENRPRDPKPKKAEVSLEEYIDQLAIDLTGDLKGFDEQDRNVIRRVARRTKSGGEEMIDQQKAFKVIMRLIDNMKDPRSKMSVEDLQNQIYRIANRAVDGRLIETSVNKSTRASEADWEKAFQAQVVIGADLEKRIAELEGSAPLRWIDGSPDKLYGSEWFIAQTTYGDRVVLKSLPEEYGYDYKTADDTYFMRDKIKRWMQFPDSRFVPFTVSSLEDRVSNERDSLKAELDQLKLANDIRAYAIKHEELIRDIKAIRQMMERTESRPPPKHGIQG